MTFQQRSTTWDRFTPLALQQEVQHLEVHSDGSYRQLLQCPRVKKASPPNDIQSILTLTDCNPGISSKDVSCTNPSKSESCTSRWLRPHCLGGYAGDVSGNLLPLVPQSSTYWCGPQCNTKKNELSFAALGRLSQGTPSKDRFTLNRHREDLSW